MNRFDRYLLFCQSLQTARADFSPLAVNFFGLQINVKPALGGDIGVAARNSADCSSAAFFTYASHIDI